MARSSDSRSRCGTRSVCAGCLLTGLTRTLPVRGRTWRATQPGRVTYNVRAENTASCPPPPGLRDLSRADPGHVGAAAEFHGRATEVDYGANRHRGWRAR